MNHETSIPNMDVNTPEVPNEPVVVAPSSESTTPVETTDDPAVGVVGFGAFFGSSILFSIPVIGWIASIVMSFAPKRKSLKNYARVMLLWTTLGLLISVLLFTAVTSVLNTLVIAPLNEQLGTEFKGVFQVVQTAQDVKRGKYSSVLKQFKNQFPEEMQPLVEELSTGEYDELIQLVVDGDYEEAVTELSVGSHEKLEAVLGEETYTTVVNELKDAANGETKPWMEQVKQISEADMMSMLEQFMG